MPASVFDFTVALKIHPKKIILNCWIHNKTITEASKLSALNDEFLYKTANEQPFAEKLCFKVYD